MQRTPLSVLVVVAFWLVALPAFAQDSSPAGRDLAMPVAVDIFGGGHFFAEGTNLGVAAAPEATDGAHSNAALGLRVSLGVGPWLAAEVECLGMLTTDRTYGRSAGILGYRFNALAYLRRGDLRPFLLIGAGPMQVATTRAEGKAGLIRDVEGEFHVGLGLGYRLADFLSLRADARAVQMPGKQIWSLTTDLEATLGFSFTLAGHAPASHSMPPATPLAQAGGNPAGDRLGGAKPAAAFATPAVPPPMAPAFAPLASAATTSHAPGSPVAKPAPPTEQERATPPVTQGAPQAPSPPAGAAPIVTTVSKVKAILSRAREIKFEGASARISLVALPLIGELAEEMLKEPGLQLEVISHTAASGVPKKDMALSRRRADAIKSALVEREVPASRVTATGRGSEEPLAPNVTRSGRKLNERIELRLLGIQKPSR